MKRTIEQFKRSMIVDSFEMNLNHLDFFTWACSDAVFSFVMLLKELDEMVLKMVFEALGVSKYLHSHLESLVQSLRLSHYRAPKTQEPTPGLGIHTDLTSISIVCQHEREGLQILTKDGSWITPSRSSLVFLVGDVLSVCSLS